jgi:hypothetical protein
MKSFFAAVSLAALTFLGTSVEASPLEPRAASHTFTLINKCSYAVQPKIANTRCGYSPRSYHFFFSYSRMLIPITRVR